MPTFFFVLKLIIAFSRCGMAREIRQQRQCAADKTVVSWKTLKASSGLTKVLSDIYVISFNFEAVAAHAQAS